MTPTGTDGRTLLKWMFWGLALVLAVWYGHARYTEAKEKAEAKKAEAVQEAEYVKTHPPQQRVVVHAERPWTSRTFDIPAEGLRLWLEPGSARYPKLGGVLTHTSSGQSYVDRPGVDHNGINNPAGWFTFLPDPPGPRREIEIYNRW